MKITGNSALMATLLLALLPAHVLCQEKDGSALLTVVASNSNTNVFVRQVTIDTYADHSCEQHERIQYVRLKRGTESRTGKPLKIKAERPFFLDFSYIQPSPGLVTTCLVSGSFSPLPNKAYVARFNVAMDGSNCGAKIYDIESQGEIGVEFVENEIPCAITMNRSGVGTRVVPQIEMTRVP